MIVVYFLCSDVIAHTSAYKGQNEFSSFQKNYFPAVVNWLCGMHLILFFTGIYNQHIS